MQLNELKKGVLIVTSEGFPNGNAVANRIITIAKGLLDYGYSPEVLIKRNTELKSKPINGVNGNIDGIDYKYAYHINTRGHSFIYTIFLKAAFLINTIGYLFLKRSNTRLIIVYTTSLFNELILIFISRFLKIEIWKDESEIPEIYFYKNNIYSNCIKIIYLKFIYKQYDGLILITDNLIDYFEQKLKNKRVKLVNIPMMVDFDRFRSVSSKIPNKEKTICYVGSINKSKDGVDHLIIAFNKVLKYYPNIKLLLVGEYSLGFEAEFDLQSFLNSDKIEFDNKIILTGKVDSIDVVKYLNNADILVLPRPNSKQAEYGFPTKLGEYLASKRPVICTIFGEVEKYLTNNQNCLLIPANNINALVKALTRLIEDETFAIEIGNRGFQCAEANFNKANIFPLINEITTC